MWSVEADGRARRGSGLQPHPQGQGQEQEGQGPELGPGATPGPGSGPRRGQEKRRRRRADAARGMSRPGRRGCCTLLHLKEDNARFILLAVVMCMYMAAGAGVFMLLEADNELRERAEYEAMYQDFLANNPLVNVTDLQRLLRKHALADSAGIVGQKRARWDFPGSFYFVGTVVSTIGESC